MSQVRHDDGPPEGPQVIRAWIVVAASVLLLPTLAHAADEHLDGFPAVQDLVRKRAGAAVQWERNGRQEGWVADSVGALLQGELTAERAAQIALLNNRSLQVVFEEIGVSQADLRQAGLPKNPSIEGEVRAGGGMRRPAELVFMQDLSSILLQPLRRRAATSKLSQSTLEAAHAAFTMMADTRSAFYSLQAGEQVRDLWSATAAAAQASADLAQRQREAGNITSLDLENQQALYEDAKIELARSNVEVAAARERLNQLMGTWGAQTSWTATSALPVISDSGASLEGLESVAITQRADLAAAAAEVRASTQMLPLARFSQFPELRAGLHVEGDAEGRRTTGPAVEIAFPLFDRGQAAVDRARAQMRQALDRQTALAVEIRSEVRVSRDRLTAAHQQAKYYRDVVLPRRKRIVEQTQLEYNGMLVGVYQLLQAKQSQVSAERDYIEAQRDYWIARAMLERALAGPLPAQGDQ